MLEKVLNNVPLNEFYKDLFGPGMKKAGQALETVIDGANLILLPLKLVNAKSRIYFDKNIKRYSDKINSNSGYTLSVVPKYVGLPILDKLTYLDENELSETFINLLTKASFEETLKFVHPAYLSILERLSVDEAKILFYYKNQSFIPFVDMYVHKYVEKIKKPDYFDSKESKSAEQIKLMIEYSTQNKESIYIKLYENLSGIENEVELLFPKNIQLYIENLALNGLIKFERILHHKDYLEKYRELINKDYKDIYEESSKSINGIREGKVDEIELALDVRKGYIEFTELGKGFLNACIKEIE
ncbi:DUF4393 domain-containing protein [Flavobacterium sp. LS1R47]|uniref:DUF4393 domain-containing protein n=1 Tax=Flavobacterium frigoritolerans TaxID=2987686 RepID=A0A9X3CA29_9FLAO|nr:DUF4393 domain-containing protein [Flavobacterium frigoritolerans]MCV9934420.1 DUF4393 domain-containing protein [Flavobacterium frigoritolerans]